MKILKISQFSVLKNWLMKEADKQEGVFFLQGKKLKEKANVSKGENKAILQDFTLFSFNRQKQHFKLSFPSEALH